MQLTPLTAVSPIDGRYHAATASLAAYFSEYAVENPEAPILASIASGIAVWAILWYYRKQSTITWSIVYRTDDLTPTSQFIA